MTNNNTLSMIEYRRNRWAFTVLVLAVLGACVAGSAFGQTVGSLITELQKHDPNAPVFVMNPAGAKSPLWVSRDGESVVLLPFVAPPPPPPGVEHMKPQGLYLLQPAKHGMGNTPSDLAYPTANRNATLAMMQLPDVAGLTIRCIPRAQLFNANGSWNENTFKLIDADIRECRTAGKGYTILPVKDDRPITPALLAEHDRIDVEFARRYGNDKHLAGYHVTGTSPPDHSEELHYFNGMPEDMIQATIARIRHARKCFPGVTLLVAQGGNKSNDAAMRKIANAVKDCAPIVWKHNRLKAFDANGKSTLATWPNTDHNRILVEVASMPGVDYRAGMEFVGSTLEKEGGKPRLGTTDLNVVLKQAAIVFRKAGENPAEAYVAFYLPDAGKIRKDELK